MTYNRTSSPEHTSMFLNAVAPFYGVFQISIHHYNPEKLYFKNMHVLQAILTYKCLKVQKKKNPHKIKSAYLFFFSKTHCDNMFIPEKCKQIKSLKKSFETTGNLLSEFLIYFLRYSNFSNMTKSKIKCTLCTISPKHKCCVKKEI